MSKITQVYLCSNCDAQSPKWSGRCLSCGAWGSIGKDPIMPGVDETAEKHPTSPGKTQKFIDLVSNAKTYLATNFKALDQVLGGGLVPGSATLVAGEPGMGKSTMLSQVAIAISSQGKRALYVTGEESPAQIRLRLARLEAELPSDLMYLDETQTEKICATIEQDKPDVVIIDSIQSLTSSQASGEAGSVLQVKISASLLTQTAKKTNTPILIVGQVTKDNEIAGPRILEHVVDTVLTLEGDKLNRYRILRAIKHRFGSTDETALLDMEENGLKIIADPSSALLESRLATAPGSAVGCILEGRRPMLVEIQALVTASGYSAPVRKATGLDASRLSMLLAVLTRHAGVSVYDKDVFANAAGGLSIRDTSSDLTLAAAIASAVQNKPLDKKTVYFGEIGLTGELRPVALPELRIKEISRMGFEKVVCPGLKQQIKNIEIVACKNIREALF